MKRMILILIILSVACFYLAFDSFRQFSFTKMSTVQATESIKQLVKSECCDDLKMSQLNFYLDWIISNSKNNNRARSNLWNNSVIGFATIGLTLLIISTLLWFKRWNHYRKRIKPAT